MNDIPEKPTAGAHGLFAAFGNKTKPVHVIDDDGNITKGLYLPRKGDDFYPTPPEPTRAFCKAEMRRLSQFKHILEPAAGNGCMARDLHECTGIHVLLSDIVDRGCGANIISFYDYLDLPLNTCIVTNPPFNECNWRDGKAKWMRHALENLECKYMALLLPWGWMGAGGMGGFWKDHPPARVYLMRWKIDFTGQGAPPMLNCWAVWDKEHKGETVLRMLDKYDDPRQPEFV